MHYNVFLFFLDIFYYHMNNTCYNKSYTLRLSKCKAVTVEESKIEESKNDRPERKYNPNACLIYNQITFKKVKEKMALTGKERAKKLFDCIHELQDDVFIRIAMINTVDDFLNANFKYHKVCIENYLKRYEHLNSKSNEEVDKIDINAAIFDIIKTIQPEIDTGTLFSLSDVEKLIKDKYGSELTIKYSKIKSCLIEHFDDKIAFVYQKVRNKSQIFYTTNAKAIENYYNKNSIKECANILSDAMKNVNFNLNDKFCDECDLRLAWENIDIPDSFVSFFSTFFNFKMKNIYSEEENNDPSSSRNDVTLLRIKALFQIMYFLKYKGPQKTPLHILLGLFIHQTTRSKSAITTLNHLGLSISYDHILRIRTCLACYTEMSCENCMPLPSHFNPNNYTTAAFDNFDHNDSNISGLETTHDTVSVIFQNYDKDFDKTKPSVSSVNIDARSKSLKNILKCQEINTSFNKLPSTINIPSDYTVNANIVPLTVQDFYRNILQIDDLAWYITRMDISNNTEIFALSESQEVPAWSCFNASVTEDKRQKQIVGYLPDIPAPVTQPSIVYTCLCNFKDLLKQLNQTHLVIACDEGVYKLARHIKLQREKEFDSLILVLGGFHLIKVILSCIGKYLKKSGVEHIFIETGLFGVLVTDQVLQGTNYAR